MFRILISVILLAALAGCGRSPISMDPTAAAPPAPAPTPPPPAPAPADPPAETTASTAPAGQPVPEAPPIFSVSTQDTNVAGIAADFTECGRKDGVLSVKIRFRNTNPGQASISVINQKNFAAIYYTAANKKYFMLKDSEGTFLTSATDDKGTLAIPLASGGQYTWWAKFPAPPANVKRISLMTPVAPPFDNVAITDQ